MKLQYTPEALNARLVGEVVLKLQVGDDGQVSDVTVIRSNSEKLTDAAVAIAKSSVISCTEGWAGEVFADVFDFDLKMKREGKVINRSALVKRNIRPWALRPTEPVAPKWCEPASVGLA